MGEKAAAQYLYIKGYMILFQNYRKKFGEIDLIARSPSGVLVIVEVKTLFSAKQSLGCPMNCLARNNQLEAPINCLARNNCTNSSELFRAKQSLRPEDNLTAAKLRRIHRIAEFFINSHPDLLNEDMEYRIDLIAVDLSCNEVGRWKAIIRHHEGVG